MSRIHVAQLGGPRTVLLAVLGLAVLATAALLLVPADRSLVDGDPDAGRATSAEPAPDTDAAEGAGGEQLVERGLQPGASSEKELLLPTDDESNATIEVSGAVQGGAAGGGAPAADGVASAPGTGASLALPGLDAKIIRTGAVVLRLKRGSFDTSWSDAQAVATGLGGQVLTASRSGVGDGPRSGTMTLRVPGGRFEAALERLREVPGAKVERLDVASQDVTQEFVDVKARLRHDRAVEGRLLSLLARTETVSEVLAVQARLDQVQEQIEVSKGRLDYLQHMTAYSTIELALREKGARGGSERDEPGIGEALGEARERFTERVADGIVWVGGALPALLLVALAVVVGMRWVRRRSDDRPAAATPARDGEG